MTIKLRESLVKSTERYNQAERIRESLFQSAEQLANIPKPDPDESEWTPLIGFDSLVGGEVPKEQVESKANKLRAQAYRAYYTNPHARSIITGLVSFVVGTGAEVQILGEDFSDKDIAQIKDYWQAFEDRNKWDLVQEEIIRRGERDGEWFLHFIPTEKNGKEPTALIHFIEPDWIRSSKPEITYGIETENNEVSNIVSYRINRGEDKDEEVPPGLMQHGKRNVDLNVKRGRSTLEPVLKDLAEFADIRHIRAVENRFRATVVMVRKSSNVANQAAALNTQRATSGRTGKGLKSPKPGTQITVDKESDIEFKNPNLGAQDASHDMRLMGTAISAGVGMPEFIVTSDASNNNRASLREASLQMIKNVERMQKYYRNAFCDIFNRVIAFGIASGHLNEKFSEIKCDFKFPTFDIRDMFEDARAFQILWTMGLLSSSSIATHFGYNFVEEMEQLQNDNDVSMFAEPFNNPDDFPNTNTDTPDDGEE